MFGARCPRRRAKHPDPRSAQRGTPSPTPRNGQPALRYERMARLPEGWLPFGDAISSFDPVYGQGMTSAMLHASALSEYLRTGPDLTQPARPYFRDAKVIVEADSHGYHRRRFETP